MSSGNVPSACPVDECRCEEWPPTECPQCGVATIGFTPEDWYHHFDGPCEPLGALYCFVKEPTEAKL